MHDIASSDHRNTLKGFSQWLKIYNHKPDGPSAIEGSKPNLKAMSSEIFIGIESVLIAVNVSTNGTKTRVCIYTEQL